MGDVFDSGSVARSAGKCINLYKYVSWVFYVFFQCEKYNVWRQCVAKPQKSD